MGPRYVHTNGDLSPHCKFSLKFAAARREETCGDRSDNGLFCEQRSDQPRMVSSNTGDDDEYGTLDSAWRVASDCEREVYQGTQGVNLIRWRIGMVVTAVVL